MVGKRISRRTFLAGAGGLAVSLPMLEAMIPRSAKAQTGPMRYVIAVQGISQPTANGRNDGMFDPLRDDGVIEDVAVIKGIDLPAGSGPAHRNGAFHKSVISPMMAGVSTPTTGGAIQAITSDQIVAQHFAGQTTIPSLRLSTQTRPAGQRNGYGGAGKGANMSHDGNGALTHTESPLAAWEQLFTGVTAPPAPSTPPSSCDPMPCTTPPPAPTPGAMGRILEQNRSVLDVAAQRAASLRTIVSRADWSRIEEHFEAIRDLERKIALLIPGPVGGPSAGIVGPGVTGNGCVGMSMPTEPSQGATWSNETLRGEIFADMIALAFACDLTRSVAWQLSWWQCAMSLSEISGVPEDMHYLTHNNASDGQSRVHHQTVYSAWHVKMYSRLLANLKAITDAATGEPLLNNTAAVMLFESVSQHGFGSSGMSCLIGGRSSDLNLNREITARGAHTGHIINSAFQSIGIDQDLGELRGPISGLMR